MAERTPTLRMRLWSIRHNRHAMALGSDREGRNRYYCKKCNIFPPKAFKEE